MSAPEESSEIPDEYVDRVIAFLRGVERDNAQSANVRP